MSIEEIIRAICVEEIQKYMTQGQIPAQQPQMPGPSGTGPGQTVPGAPPAPVTAAVSPVAVPPGPPAPAPSPPPAPVATLPTAPGAVTPPPAQAAFSPGVTLDQIRDKLNQFWRAHPERAGEIMVILGQVGVTDVSQIPPANFQFVWDELAKLGA